MLAAGGLMNLGEQQGWWGQPEAQQPVYDETFPWASTGTPQTPLFPGMY